MPIAHAQKNLPVILVILLALLLITITVLVFNKRIERIEMKRKPAPGFNKIM